MVLWRGWRLPEGTGEKIFEKWAVAARAEMVLGDVSAPQVAVRTIEGAREVFCGKEGLISPTREAEPEAGRRPGRGGSHEPGQRELQGPLDLFAF